MEEFVFNKSSYCVLVIVVYDLGHILVAAFRFVIHYSKRVEPRSFVPFF